MKLFSRPFGSFVVLSLLCAVLAIAGCHKKVSKPSPDVVRDFQPVSSSLAGVDMTIAQLAQLPQAQRAAALAHNWPNLANDVAYYVRETHLIQAGSHIEAVNFLFGSLSTVKANDASGNWHDGHANNQLVAQVHIVGDRTPRNFFVLCFNGMVAPVNQMDGLQPVSGAPTQSEFTIRRHEDLNMYVDLPVAIDLAQRFHLHIYKGRSMSHAAEINPGQARLINPDDKQVTVRVYSGDHFNLEAGTYTTASGHRVAVKRSVKAKKNSRHHSTPVRRNTKRHK